MAEEKPAAAAVVPATVVPRPTTPVPKQPVMMSVDRAALRSAIGALANPNAKQDWCIACGAGASADPIEKIEALQPLTKELLGGKTFPEFLKSLEDFGNQAWCIACGAGKDASPLDLLGNPAAMSDAEIDAIAARLLSAVRVG